MRILVFGAGVIGTIYAARLKAGGHSVTVVARGQRLANIRRCGLLLEDLVSARLSTIPVETAEQIAGDDDYDVALVTVRLDQLAGVLPSLRANRGIPTLLFMLNNPVGLHDLVSDFGADRVLFGFPGAGGALDGDVVRYALIPQQPTTLGEWSGRRTERVRMLADTFRESGFRTAISGDMDAWLKTHAFFVTAVSGAIYLAGGNCRLLSNDHATLALMTRGVREGFAAIRTLGFAVTPLPLKALFTWMPSWFAVLYWRRFLATESADWVFGRHARTAAREMLELAKICRGFLDKAGLEAPALQRLYRAIDSFAEVSQTPT